MRTASVGRAASNTVTIAGKHPNIEERLGNEAVAEVFVTCGRATANIRWNQNKEWDMPYRLEVHGYSLIVSSIAHGRHWQGVVHVMDPAGQHGRTIETLAHHATSEDAERVAATLGTDHVRGLIGDESD